MRANADNGCIDTSARQGSLEVGIAQMQDIDLSVYATNRMLVEVFELDDRVLVYFVLDGRVVWAVSTVAEC